MAMVPAGQAGIPPNPVPGVGGGGGVAGGAPGGIPPGNPPPPANPAATPLPAFLTPAAVPGEITKLMMVLNGNNTHQFKQRVQIDMDNMDAFLSEADGLRLLGYATGLASGPCAFLIIGPSMFSAGSIIEVMHCTKQYFIPATQAGAATDPLRNRILCFMGDMTGGQLPKIVVEPINGLPASFPETPTQLPSDGMIDGFYANHPPTELYGRAPGGTPNTGIRKLAYIPQAWIPAFMEGLPPKVALDRARILVNLMPLAEQGKYNYILEYLRAACQKLGGPSHFAESSKQMVQLQHPHRTPSFNAWALKLMAEYYSNINPVGPQGGPQGTAPPGGFDFRAFGNNLTAGITTGISTSLAQATQGWIAAQPLQSTKTKEDWTKLQKENILKVMGKPQTAIFEDEAPDIWAEFVDEGKSSADIQRVLRSKLIRAPDPDIYWVNPHISRQMATEIKACSFAPSVLTTSTTVHGVMPLAMAPRPAAERIDDDVDDDNEDRATYLSVSNVEHRKKKDSRKARAPKDYTSLMDALAAAVAVWRLLFSPQCPLVIQTNVMRERLIRQRDVLMYVMTPFQVATIMWKFSMHVMEYISDPYQFNGDVSPLALQLMMTDARTNTFNPCATMPREFIAMGETKGATQGISNGQYAGEESFGEDPAPKGGGRGKLNPQTYHHVDPAVAAVLADFKKIERGGTMGTLLRNYKGLRVTELVLVPGHCVDYMALGQCPRGPPLCTYNHEQTVRAPKDKVEEFCRKCEPVVKHYIDTHPRKKQKV